MDSWAGRILFRVSGNIGWITLAMIGFWRDDDCLVWDGDYHDVIFGCFVWGLTTLSSDAGELIYPTSI